jgi:hypothetical protein
MQNIWLKMSMGLLACGPGLVVEGGVHKLLAQGDHGIFGLVVYLLGIWPKEFVINGLGSLARSFTNGLG